ncbi:MAG: hydrogenase maturation nickel metallochaperone HypA [Planctomycetes bacterium]|nr:hydrogenase maturation nickel metallochaperone HypA [Planctomycetota bacterium]
MHEVSLVQALFDAADLAIAPHPSAAVRLLKVRVGELAGVETESLRTAFELCRGERGYGDAELELVSERARWSCRACGSGLRAGAALRCELCGGEGRLAAGGELVLDRVELDVVEA